MPHHPRQDPRQHLGQHLVPRPAPADLRRRGTPARRRTSVPVILAIVLAVVASACAAGGGAEAQAGAVDVEVRPFEEIQDSEVTVERDPTDPSRMIFRVTTTEPAICAIVWGTDESFGRFNNSLAMNGTGIVQHDVVLPDVTADTTYVYVLQGTTADGTLFRSEVMSFDSGPAPTTAAAAEVDRGPNLALDAAIAEVSSEFGDSFAAELAIDGDLATEWSSAGDGDGAFLTLDLGVPTDIGALAFITRSMADGSAITEEFTVTTGSGEVVGPFPAGNPADPRVVEVDLTATTLRFEVVASTGGNVGAVEVLLFAP